MIYIVRYLIKKKNDFSFDIKIMSYNIVFISYGYKHSKQLEQNR